MNDVVRVARWMFDIRVWYLIFGVCASVIAHEAFHILMHIDTVHAIRLFPDALTIVAVDIGSQSGLNVVGEEAIAYSITFAILFVTVADVYAIHDSRSQYSVMQQLGFDEAEIGLLQHVIE